MDPTKCTKIDALSRETTLAEGQVDDMPNTAAATNDEHHHSSSPASDDDEGDGDDDLHEPSHPSEPGAYKPPGAAGYAHLAEFMTETQLGMVRKYKDLSLMNLLYLQAEIHQLRKEWDEEVQQDARAGLNEPEREGEVHGPGERRLWDYHWAAMAEGKKRGLEGKRWEVWGRLKKVLHEYHYAIKAHEHICALPTPSNAQRTFLSKYIVDDSLNGGRCAFLSPELRGEEPEAYREEWLDDLTVFEHGPEAHDGFARWVVMPVLKAAHCLWLGKGKKPIHPDVETGLASAGGGDSNEKHPRGKPTALVPLYQYNATCYTTLNRILNAIMIILIPCAAIVSLNAVPNPNKRVGMICAFSLVCAVFMALCSGASRMEIFAVSAAFMSVQLVFVGQQGGS